MNEGKFENNASHNMIFNMINLFKTITDKHAPIKQIRIRGSIYDKITQKSYPG